MSIQKRFLLAGAIAFWLGPGAVAGNEWDMPTPYGDSNFHTVNIHAFADDVEKNTGGALRITVHSAGSLIRHPEIRNAIRRGLVPVGEVLMSRLGNEDSVFEVDSVPFLATDYRQARALWEASSPVIRARLEEAGLELLFAVPWPPQGIYANREVGKVEDLAGMKLRVYNAATERLAGLVNAVPTQVEVSDIPVAFASGRVEAMITSPSTGANTKAWDYVSHFHDTRAWLPKNMVIVNRKAFMRLDAEVRETVLAAARRAEERGWTASRAETEAKTAVLRENGMTVTMPDAELTEGLRAVGRTMAEEWSARAGEAGRAILGAYRQ